MFGRPTIIAIGDSHVRRIVMGEGESLFMIIRVKI